MSQSGSARKCRIAFCHPDLGLGGAERLVVDAAAELARRGHQVDIYTAHYDPARCFQETKSGAFSVTVCGNWFPRSLGNKFIALCAYVRCLLVALHIAWTAWRQKAQYEVVFVDQVSAVVPALHAFTSSKVLFYCHFPDLLLAQRASRIRRLYRAPLDCLEQSTTGQADLLLVNSLFTRGVFEETFQRLAARGVVPEVLYPAVSIPSEQQQVEAMSAWRNQFADRSFAAFLEAGPTFLSINRFERKKDLGLAVRALGVLLTQHAGATREVSACRLVLAGGYDPRVAENREHFEEVKVLITDLGLQEKVRLLPSFTDAQRSALLTACRAVVYTPQNEHFGIVPLEAMAASRAVVACDSGGPRESVVDGVTGMLCRPDPVAFAAAMAKLTVKSVAERLGRNARAHVQRSFSRPAFGSQLERYVLDLAENR